MWVWEDFDKNIFFKHENIEDVFRYAEKEGCLEYRPPHNGDTRHTPEVTKGIIAYYSSNHPRLKRRKRPSYYAACQWIADNDNPGAEAGLEEIQDYLTVCLVADIFGKTTKQVARAVKKRMATG